jgi:hypothetical protein
MLLLHSPAFGRPVHFCPVSTLLCCPHIQAVALSQLVLELLSRPELEMAVHTADYFLMANIGGVTGR